MPGVMTRDGEVVYIPTYTQEQRNALWAAIVKAAAPELVKNLHKEENASA